MVDDPLYPPWNDDAPFWCVSIDYKITTVCEYLEPDRYLLEYEGRIRGVPQLALDTEPALGTCNVVVIQEERALRDGQPRDVFFDATAETWDLYDQLYDKQRNERIKPIIDINARRGANVLLIDRLEIKRQFRGQGIGGQVVTNVIETFGPGCGLIAAKPFPLAYEGYKDDSPRATAMRAKPNFAKKLNEEWSRVSLFWQYHKFVPVPKTEYSIYPWPD